MYWIIARKAIDKSYKYDVKKKKPVKESYTMWFDLYKVEKANKMIPWC